MNKLKKIMLVVILLFTLSFVITKSISLSKTNINQVLNKQEYSYLSEEAKEYIKEVYEASGEVILTEKNKQDGVPYLNPEYANYLSLSEEEQEQVEVIPDVYLVDFIDNNYNDTTLPSSYDLRNVNGKNFITSMKDQGELGICWAFTTAEQAESYLLVKNNTSYNSSSQLFSSRQMDFAVSNDGIKNYNKTDNMYRSLSSGGNFLMSSIAVANGISLVGDSTFPFDESSEARDLKDVLNYNNSLYEADSSIYLNGFTTSTTNSEKESYIKTIKKNIMLYGGAWVGTKSPQSNCSALNTNGTYVIDVDTPCQNNSQSSSGHAMQIIGWDDNYSYSYCVSGTKHFKAINGVCSEGGLVTGKGAWLLRNSWGTSEYLKPYQYVYLTYNSLAADVGVLTSLSSMKDRTWDNNYHKNPWLDTLYYTRVESNVFSPGISNQEKIEKVKFFAMSQNATYQVAIKVGNNTYKKDVTVALPGIVTTDFSDKNIVVDSDFSVEITSNTYYVFKTSTSVFTSNVDNIPKIKTEDVDIDVRGSNNNYEIVVYSDTKNIPSGDTVTYGLYKNNVDVTKYINVTNNIVAINNMNTIINVDNHIPTGEYELRTTYDNKTYSSIFNVVSDYTIEGTGTESDPYLIHDESELLSINNNLSAYYKLANDISLSNSFVPIGTITNPFIGSLDGDNHKITGLKIIGNYDYSGLFGYVTNNDDKDVVIKNIIIDNPNMESNGDVGSLIGHLEMLNYNNTVSIDNIYIMGGSITSSTDNTGSLIGIIDSASTSKRVSINRIFSSSTINGTNNVGVIGAVLNSAKADINYIQNVGIIHISDVNNNFGTIVGNSVYDANDASKSSITVANFINTSYVIVNNDSNKIYSHITNHDINNTNANIISNGVYVSKYSDLYYYSAAHNKVLPYENVVDLKSASFTDFIDNYSENFEAKTIDSVSRIPVLKNVDFNYTSIADISVDNGSTISLLNSVTPKTSIWRIKTNIVQNDSVVSLVSSSDDIKIEGKKTGEAIIHVISDYDGFEKDININVVAKKVKITYYANDGTGSSFVKYATEGKVYHIDDNTFNYTGHSFVKWNTSASNAGTGYNVGDFITAENDLVLYAIWRNNTYQVKYNSNGGTGSMTNQNLTYDISDNLSNNTFVKSGYTFKEWNTKADGTGTKYSDGASVINLTNTDKAIVNLYAIWKQDITYVINNYTYDTNSKYIDKISLNTSKDQFRSHFVLGTGYTMTVDTGDSDYINTGSKTKIYNNGTLVVEFTNVVRGDVNGDGKINSADLLKIVKHLKGTAVLNSFYVMSADCNYDDKINSADLLKIVKYLKGTGTI